VRLGHDKTVYFSLLQFRSGYVWLVQFISGYFRLRQAKSA